ncbi:MAG TPA: signal peptidase II [Myxococcales bacterium]|jgi:signal peptidase II
MTETPTPMRLPTRFILVLLILATSIGCDRATKVVAESALEGRGRLSYLGDVFRFEYVRNSGAFLSLGAKLQEPLRTVLLQGFVAVLVLGLVAYALMRGRRRVQVVALSLVAGGGIGNLWDRLVSGSVTDFMNLGIGPVRTGVFNVADLAIMAGVGMLIVWSKEVAPPAELAVAGAPPGAPAESPPPPAASPSPADEGKP